MADDTLRLGIDADASGVAAAAKDAERSLGRIGSKAKSETKNLNLYGERLGKVFGKGEGLHGRLDALEMPLRDVEGGFDRARQTAFVFGNAAETASEKATQGFLLAADSIAAFTSGGVAGVAITAAVAGFAFLSQAINEEAEAARKAEEETKKQAEALKALADAALSAGVSLGAQRSMQEMTAQSAKLLEVDDKLLENRTKQIRLLKEMAVDAEHTQQEQMRLADLSGILVADVIAGEHRLGDARKEASAELAKLRDEEEKLAEVQTKATSDLEKASRKASDERIRFSDSATKRIIDDAKLMSEAVKEAIQEVTKPQTTRGGDSGMPAAEKEAEAALKRIEERLKAEKALDDDFNEAIRRADLIEEEEHAIALLGISENARAQETEAEKAKAAADKARAKDLADFKDRLTKQSTQVALGALQAVTAGLYEQAKAGEFAAEKLLQATLDSVGKEMVAKGTLYLFEGIGSMNPVKVASGSALIAAGVGLGAVSGSLNAPEAAAATTPTDTRQSRAASSAGGGEGGTTVINFNGPAYDRRGVANVLTSGQKMARHRRVAGA